MTRGDEDLSAKHPTGVAVVVSPSETSRRGPELWLGRDHTMKVKGGPNVMPGRATYPDAPSRESAPVASNHHEPSSVPDHIPTVEAAAAPEVVAAVRGKREVRCASDCDRVTPTPVPHVPSGPGTKP